jgi:integrase
MALLPPEQDRLIQCATGPWCLPVFLDMAAATGARRGEVLDLRWSDVKGMVVLTDRSLCQTREGLVFKSTKTEEPRKVELPPSTVAYLEAHRLRQDEFRRQFGPAFIPIVKYSICSSPSPKCLSTPSTRQSPTSGLIASTSVQQISPTMVSFQRGHVFPHPLLNTLRGRVSLRYQHGRSRDT